MAIGGQEKSQPRGLESQPKALDRQPRGLECQPMAMRPSQWPGKASKARKFGKIRMRKWRNEKENQVPKFGMRILQASHFGARNECFQAAKMCR